MKIFELERLPDLSGTEYTLRVFPSVFVATKETERKNIEFQQIINRFVVTFILNDFCFLLVWYKVIKFYPKN